MIDTEKMKALAAKLRKYTGSGFVVDDATEAADAIDTLLAALDQNRIDKLEAQGAFEELDRDNNRLCAALEAAAADKRDAERYRFIKSKTKTFSLDMSGQHTYVVDFAIARLKGPSLERAIDEAISQGEKS